MPSLERYRCPDVGHRVSLKHQVDIAMQEESRGTVYSYTTVFRGVSKRFQGLAPYVLALIDLRDGRRVLSTIIGCRPEEIAIGAEVEAVPGRDPDGNPRVEYRLVGARRWPV